MLGKILKWFFIISPFIYFDLVFDASGTPRQFYLSIILFITYLTIILKKIIIKIPKTFSIIYILYLSIIILLSLFNDGYIDTIEIIKRIEYYLFFILLYNINWNSNKNIFISGIIMEKLVKLIVLLTLYLYCYFTREIN